MQSCSRVLLLLLFAWSLFGQVPPSITFGGCSGQPESGQWDFGGSISGNTVTLSGVRVGSPTYTIYWGNGVVLNNATFPAQQGYSNTATNYSLQVIATLPDGSRDCLEGAVRFQPTCNWIVDRTQLAAPSSGGSFAITVNRNAGSCALSVNEAETWLSAGAPPSSGFGIVTVTVDPNTSSNPRTGLLHLGTTVVTINQAPQTCEATLDTRGVSVGSSATSAKIGVSIPAGCAWTISSLPSWVATSPANGGTGSATVTLNFTANTGSLSRSDSITIAGQRVDLTQAGSRCLYSISPSSMNMPAEGGTGSFRISAPTGCGWTATEAFPWMSLVGNTSGTGNGVVNFSVTSNPSFTDRRAGIIRIAGQFFVISQMAQGPSLACGGEAASRELRFGGMAELLGDLSFFCSGTGPSRPTIVELTLRLNVPVTNKILNTLTGDTDALLMLDMGEGTTPVLGGNVRVGRLTGSNSLRWTFPVPADTSFLDMRLTNVRGNTAGLVLGSRVPPSVTGTIELRTFETISIDPGPYELGQAIDPINASVGSPLLLRGFAAVPVSVTEQGVDVFRPRQEQGQENSFPGSYYLSESGYMHTALKNPAIGQATSGTRILIRVPNIPSGVTVFAEYSSNDGKAGLTNADANGAGGSILVAAKEPLLLRVSGGVATATYEVTSSTYSLETLVFNFTFQGATLTQINKIREGITAVLAPLSPIASASATAAIPRFSDPASTDVVNLRVIPGAVFVPTVQIRTNSEKGSPVLLARGYEQVGSNFVFNYDVYNDSSSTADATVVRGNAPPGFQYVDCTATPSCDVSGDGSTMQANLGNMAPGATATVQVEARQVDQVPPGTYIENTVDVTTSDLDSDVDSNTASGGFIVETCGALAVSSATFRSPGGTGTVNAPAGCTWTATSTVDWISLTGATSGSAAGPVTFSVVANTTSGIRQGSILVGGRTFSVTQGAVCTFQTTPGTINAPATAGNQSVSLIQTGSGCTGTATQVPSWLIVNPSSSNQSANLTFSWQANAATVSRSATVRIGDPDSGANVTVNQAAAACTYALSASSASPGSAGGTGSFNVVTNGTNCGWTATSNAAWLTVSAPGGGTGNGSVTWTAAVNTGSSRTGTITVGGRTFTVTQGAAPCSYTLSSSAVNVPAGGQFGGLTLTAGAGCAWTATSNQSWLEVNPASGTGTGTINWNASTNATLAARSATITAGGKTFTVNQAASTCTFSLASNATSVPHTGRSGSVALTTSAGGCAWTARSSTSWAQVFPLSGTGSQTVSFTVFPNFNTSERSATLTIAGQTYTITQAANPGTEAQRFVRLLYFSFLGRLPSEQEVAFQANSGLSRTQLSVNFFRAEEFNLVGRFTAGLYVGLLDRDAEYGGWQFQRNALGTGATDQFKLINSFINGPEYALKFGSPTDVEFVRLLYRYVLLREAGPGEAEFHASTIPSLTRVGVARSFLNSPEFRNGTQARLNAFLLYSTLLLRDGSMADRAFRKGQLESGGDTALQSIIEAFVTSPEFQGLIH